MSSEPIELASPHPAAWISPLGHLTPAHDAPPYADLEADGWQALYAAPPAPVVSEGQAIVNIEAVVAEFERRAYRTFPAPAHTDAVRAALAAASEATP